MPVVVLRFLRTCRLVQGSTLHEVFTRLRELHAGNRAALHRAVVDIVVRLLEARRPPLSLQFRFVGIVGFLGTDGRARSR